MKDLSQWAFGNRRLIHFLIAVLMVGGAWSCYEMSKLEDPEIKVKVAMIATTYPGASAHQVELEVTDVLEKSIATVPHVDNIESYSYNDLSLIQVSLLSTVPTDEVEQSWDMLRRKVGDAAVRLPQGAGKPMVQDDFGNVFGIFYALTGDGMESRTLGDYAELLKRELNDVADVERVSLYGTREECINITMLQDRMAALGVKPAEVLATLNGQNQTTYTGYFDNGTHRIRVTVDDRFTTTEEIGDMLIQGHTGDQLRLRDIATVEKGTETPLRNQLFYDGEEAIGILIAASSGSDIVKVGKAVEERLAKVASNRLPAGIAVHKVFYQPERVADALGTFMVNLTESVAIVILILMVTMGFKSGMIIGISLVITVLGSFLFLKGVDGTMQRVSLGAFILAMGMLVDNAIVIIDGILVDLKRGKPRMEAMTTIGRQTAIPLLGATLIAIIAFLPIFLSPDTAGVYTRDLFIVLAVSLLLSWVLALTHVPLMANNHLAASLSDNDGEANRYDKRVYLWLRRALTCCLKHRLLCVAAFGFLFSLSAFGFRFTMLGFFPDMEYDQLYMEYKLPEGTNYTQVERDLRQIEVYLHGRPEVRHVTMSTGGTPGRYNLVRSIATPSLSYGELIIDFASSEALVKNIDEIQSYVSQHYPDAYVKLKRYNLMFKKYPIEAQFLGPDPAVLHALADSARRIMERSEAVDLVTTDWEPAVPRLTIAYDQPTARSLGISRNDVSLSLLTATSGIPIGSFHEGIHAENIYLKCADGDGSPIEDLTHTQVFSTLPTLSNVMNEETMVKLRSGTLQPDEFLESLMASSPLQQVSNGISIDWEDPVVPRFNGQRRQRVQCSPTRGIETEKGRKAIAAAIEQIPLPEGYTLKWQGERAASDEAMKYLFKNFPLAIIQMAAILILLFKDSRMPAIIFCCLPCILIGVVAVMLLTGKVFNFVAIVGTLGLMGMLIKNGIVLMDEVEVQMKQQASPTEALIVSSLSRLRPVAMASLTTILGMIPLLADAMFGSLAAAIMGGLLVSTLITLLFIPILYALFFHIKTAQS